jgi:hypothetical protein
MTDFLVKSVDVVYRLGEFFILFARVLLLMLLWLLLMLGGVVIGCGAFFACGGAITHVLCAIP